MRKLRLWDLKPAEGNHFLSGLIKGEKLYTGGLHFFKPKECPHPEYHVHEDQEVFVNLQGKATLIIDGVKHTFEMGEIAIIEPGEDHQIIADEKEPVVNLWLHAK